MQKITIENVKKSFTKFVERCKSFVGQKESDDMDYQAMEFDSLNIYTDCKPKEIKIWQILEGALEHLAMGLEEYHQGGKDRFVCHAITQLRLVDDNPDWHIYYDAKVFVTNKLSPFVTLEDWLVENKHADGNHVFQTEEGFNKLQLTRKMWLLDMIAECKEKDI